MAVKKRTTGSSFILVVRLGNKAGIQSRSGAVGIANRVEDPLQGHHDPDPTRGKKSIDMK